MSAAGWRLRQGLVRRCIGCQLADAAPRSRYCGTCRRQCCPECHNFAGRHSARCAYLRRTRRPRLTKRVDRVPLIELLAMLIRCRAEAVRRARAIVGDALAEDCVSEVALYLLERRQYLRRTPTPSYVYVATRHCCLRVLRSAWYRYTVAMDPQDLVSAESAMERQRRGQPSAALVRLPESVDA